MAKVYIVLKEFQLGARTISPYADGRVRYATLLEAQAEPLIKSGHIREQDQPIVKVEEVVTAAVDKDARIDSGTGDLLPAAGEGPIGTAASIPDKSTEAVPLSPKEDPPAEKAKAPEVRQPVPGEGKNQPPANPVSKEPAAESKVKVTQGMRTA